MTRRALNTSAAALAAYWSGRPSRRVTGLRRRLARAIPFRRRRAGSGVLGKYTPAARAPGASGSQARLRRTNGGQPWVAFIRSEEHTSELQSRFDLVCRLLL